MQYQPLLTQRGFWNLALMRLRFRIFAEAFLFLAPETQKRGIRAGLKQKGIIKVIPEGDKDD
jgi:hypothetical protein